jgi:hypothetical protein
VLVFAIQHPVSVSDPLLVSVPVQPGFPIQHPVSVSNQTPGVGFPEPGLVSVSLSAALLLSLDQERDFAFPSPAAAKAAKDAAAPDSCTDE